MIALNNNKFQIASVRALNYWRPIFIPTYLGLRIFLKQLHNVNFEKYLNGFLLRKINNRNLPRYKRFLQFKSIKDLKEYKYREFYAASPTSAISEAYCLQFLSTISSLGNRENVYSYRWPRYECEGRCFSYFFSGYKERRDNVTKMLMNNSNYTVFVYDIKNFYPSINKDTIWKRLNEHIKQLKDENIQIFIRKICKHSLNISNDGIPIGPALGHVFGNIALENIDKCMSEAIGNRYLRYVDDIFLVLKTDEAKYIHSILNELIESEGLKLHEKKYDEMSKDDWLNSVSGTEEEQLSIDFDNFIQRIKLFLWWKPGKFDELQFVFNESGIPIPLKRFFIDSQYGRFHRFMHGIIKTTNWNMPIISQLHKENQKRLLAEAIRLRKIFLKATIRLRKNEMPQNGMKKRWRVQRLRFLLNRLIYLTPINDYQTLIDLVPEIEDFFEYRILIKSIIGKKIDEIVKIPGVTVSTFASICQQQNEFKIKTYDIELLKMKGVFESFCVLSLFGIVDPPQSWIETLQNNDAELMKFCKLAIPYERKLKDFSFEDEIRTLQLGINKEKIKDIFDTRFSDQEAINLDGLLLSKYGTGY